MVHRARTLVRCLVSTFCLAATLVNGPVVLADDATARARPGDWTQGDFDARHSGYNSLERIINPSNVAGLQLVWSASLGGLTIYATPIVANGRVYIGGADGRMHAFNAATGAVAWTSKKEGLFYVDSAAFADGLVFASAIYSPLVAFDATTGDVVWTSSVVTDLRAPPTVQRHTIYVGAFDGTVYALDTRTGNVLWSASGGCCIFDQAPVVSGGRVFQVRTDDTLTAYDAADGTQLWSVTDFTVGAMAAVDGKLIYGHEPNVVARDQASGDVVWTSPYFLSADTGSPAVADGLVFAETNLSDLVALDEATGNLVWTAPARSRWGPAVANGIVFASNYSGEWDAYNEVDGTPLWSVTNDDGCFGPCAQTVPVVARGMVYLASGQLRAYKLGP